MDYSRTWMLAFSGYLNAGDGKNVQYGPYSTLLASQVSGSALSYYDGGNYYGFSYMTAYQATSNSPRNFYSGWLRPGTSTQYVGYFLRLSAGGFALVPGAYGLTSLAPPIQGGDQSAKFSPGSANVQQELINRLVAPSSGNVAFLYDASIGSYGQVTWLSQF
ncbi:MAG: hypothetical protein [Cressdnaviricota sp.]|nr:MAG: hypothetical protein [Cressdnaviricota sp.]